MSRLATAAVEIQFSRKNDSRLGPNHDKSGPKSGRAMGLNRDSKFQVTGQRGMRIGVAILIAAGLPGAPSFGQNVPIPKPAPKSRDFRMSESEPQRAPTTTSALQLKPPDPVIPDPRRNQPAS
ncbi:MAG: hypothetical protein KGK16_00300, partial [Bradyrhizobium sp.]|nr:hypothetical protein [Bradyrhizobium sp.]